MKVTESTEERATIIEACPLCGSKMDKGFIGVWRGIFWSEKKRTTLWKLPFGNDMIFRASLKGPMLEACRCTKCKLIIFQYGKAGNPVEDSP